jgi:hypothetical protein
VLPPGARRPWALPWGSFPDGRLVAPGGRLRPAAPLRRALGSVRRLAGGGRGRVPRSRSLPTAASSPSWRTTRTRTRHGSSSGGWISCRPLRWPAPRGRATTSSRPTASGSPSSPTDS